MLHECMSGILELGTGKPYRDDVDLCTGMCRSLERCPRHPTGTIPEPAKRACRSKSGRLRPRRMRNEEQILRDAVTQYAACVARTARLIAGAY